VTLNELLELRTEVQYSLLLIRIELLVNNLGDLEVVVKPVLLTGF